jgi:hypothetical protein
VVPVGFLLYVLHVCVGAVVFHVLEQGIDGDMIWCYCAGSLRFV